MRGVWTFWHSTSIVNSVISNWLIGFYHIPHLNVFVNIFSPIPSSLLTPHSSLLTPHSSLLTPHSSLLTPHSSLLTPHSSLLTPHSNAYIFSNVDNDNGGDLGAGNLAQEGENKYNEEAPHGISFFLLNTLLEQ